MLTLDQPSQPSPAMHVADDSGRYGWWIFAGFAVSALVLLAVEHRAHLLGWLPWLILLACPLMHLFMHGGHRGHGRHGPDAGDGEDK